VLLFPLQAVSRKTISVTGRTWYRGKTYFPRNAMVTLIQFQCVVVELQEILMAPGSFLRSSGPLVFADGP
jgi:hypothetical protein